ncbi:hypothetical protein DFP72DRAFT_901763 [Ephemerocybe angulata]|uniref:RING-type domain-containing protein n=1 Tax=Ephemerocybe angulata TaxID=980116 RepID=A0A8H6M6U5_9AGAR|nr:hypothetical protein DFP72DRAFT_901763 [Tulosesus angulatus]
MSGICAICLSEYDDPVCIPCGHIFCLDCLTSAVNRPGEVELTSKCPKCRNDFCLVTPDLALLPARYRPFVASPLRKVYLDEWSGAEELAAALRKNEQDAAKIRQLERDNAQARANEQARRMEYEALQARAGHSQTAMETQVRNWQAAYRNLKSSSDSWQQKAGDLEHHLEEREKAISEEKKVWEDREVMLSLQNQSSWKRELYLRQENEYLKARLQELSQPVAKRPLDSDPQVVAVEYSQPEPGTSQERVILPVPKRHRYEDGYPAASSAASAHGSVSNYHVPSAHGYPPTYAAPNPDADIVVYHCPQNEGGRYPATPDTGYVYDYGVQRNQQGRSES